jgi:glycopeptide antibiotics resistance protein
MARILRIKNVARENLTIALFAVYLLLLAGIILFKLPFYSPEISDGIRVINLIPFQGSFDENDNFLLREILSNTLIFMPFGVYISMLKGEWTFIKKALPIIGAPLVFEILQYIFAMGRSDITDLLDNTLGGIIGIGIYVLLLRIFGNRAAMIVNILALAVTVYVVARFGYLVWLSYFVMGR